MRFPNTTIALATLACVANAANAQVIWDAPDPFPTEENGGVAATPNIGGGGGLLGIGVPDPLGDAERNVVGEIYFPGTQKFVNINTGFTDGVLNELPIEPTDIGRTVRWTVDYYFPPNSSFDNLGLDGEGNPISPDLFWLQLNANNANVGLSFGFLNPLSEAVTNPTGWNTLTYETVIPEMVEPLNGDPASVPTQFTPQIVFADGGFGAGTPNGSATPAIYLDNIQVEIIDTVVEPTLMADFNGDGTVDLLDLDILGQNFGMPGTMATGDANDDGAVDLLDLDILGQEFGMSAASAVPEPASTALLLLGAAGAAWRRR